MGFAVLETFSCVISVIILILKCGMLEYAEPAGCVFQDFGQHQGYRRSSLTFSEPVSVLN